MLGRLGWRMSDAGERKQRDAFLPTRALEHDAPGVLLQLTCDWLGHDQIVRPSIDVRGGSPTAHDGARAETYYRMAGLLMPATTHPTRLNALLDVDEELGMTRLAWLRRGATAATSEVLKLSWPSWISCALTAPIDSTCRPCRPVGGGCGRDR